MEFDRCRQADRSLERDLAGEQIVDDFADSGAAELGVDRLCGSDRELGIPAMNGSFHRLAPSPEPRLGGRASKGPARAVAVSMRDDLHELGGTGLVPIADFGLGTRRLDTPDHLTPCLEDSRRPPKHISMVANQVGNIPARTVDHRCVRRRRQRFSRFDVPADRIDESCVVHSASLVVRPAKPARTDGQLTSRRSWNAAVAPCLQAARVAARRLNANLTGHEPILRSRACRQQTRQRYLKPSSGETGGCWVVAASHSFGSLGWPPQASESANLSSSDVHSA